MNGPLPSQHTFGNQAFRVNGNAWVIKIPLILCKAVIAVSLCVAAVCALAGRWDFVRECTPAIAIPFIVWLVVRWTKSATILEMEKDGVTFKGLSARWTAPWTNIIAVRTRSAWEGTSAGGYSAGVRLTLRDGRTRDIPDYLVLPRADLAHLIDMRRKQASDGA